MIWATQKGFQLTSLILKKISAEIRFDKKMVNKSGKGFLLTTKFYKSTNNSDILAPEKWNPEGKVSIQMEGAAVKK